MTKMKFGDVEENVVTREEMPVAEALKTLESETIAVLGYGIQGPAQALNLRDNGFRVIVGQRKNSPSWDKAVEDGWKENENLFTIEEACERGTILCFLLSDAGQIAAWPTVKAALKPGKALCFSHGFAVTYADKTGVVPPPDVDVFLVAPKGSGRSVRRLFLANKGINSSFAVYQDATGKARQRAMALGIGIGSGYLFETDFRKEVYSDLVGERGILIGALAGLIEAQFELLRAKGHSPSEAFNETVEELTESLVPLVGENGMDWMLASVSTTAQRGALDWKGRFRDATRPVFEQLYADVASGREAEIVIEANSRIDYRARLEAELAEVAAHECWRAGKAVRKLRPS